LVITTAVFPIYYSSITDPVVEFLGMKISNTVLYAYTISFSFLVVALLSPILSGIADYAGRKKLFMQIFSTIGAFSAMGLFFFQGMDTLGLGLGLAVVASIGFAGSLVFYNAFLPEIALPEQMDKVSARGFTMGYIGSSIQLILSLVLIMFGPDWGIDKGLATRISFLSAGIWWFGFAFITWRGLPEIYFQPVKGKGQIFSQGFKELKSVFMQLNQKGNGALRLFLLAFFFYSMGYMTVIYLATPFAEKELHMQATELILTIMIIQFVGIAGSYAFAWLSSKIGNIRAIMVSVVIWSAVCGITYFVQDSVGFYGVAFCVGTVMGGIQALSRSTYAKLLPEGTHDHASFYAFYDITEKLGITLGSYSFGLIEVLTGSMRGSALFLCVFFAVGLILLAVVDAMRRRAGMAI